MSKALSSRIEIASDLWMSPRESAIIAGHHVQTILKACRKGAIRHSRSGRLGHIRILRSELQDWMRQREVRSETR
jgi:excisionase family DNA binding protein